MSKKKCPSCGSNDLIDIVANQILSCRDCDKMIIIKRGIKQ